MRGIVAACGTLGSWEAEKLGNAIALKTLRQIDLHSETNNKPATTKKQKQKQSKANGKQSKASSADKWDGSDNVLTRFWPNNSLSQRLSLSLRYRYRQEMRRVSYGYTDTNLSAEQIALVRERVKRVRELGDTKRLVMGAWHEPHELRH